MSRRVPTRHSRDNKRYLDKKNKKQREERKKEDIVRVRTLVGTHRILALQCVFLWPQRTCSLDALLLGRTHT